VGVKNATPRELSIHTQFVLLPAARDAVAAGDPGRDFGGGQVFDQAALVALQKQAQNFSTLPQPSAGQVVTDESFKQPSHPAGCPVCGLLNESNAFATQLTALLSVLSKDTALIDQLLG